MKSLLIDTSNNLLLGLSDQGHLLHEFSSASLKTSSALAEQLKFFLEHSNETLHSIDYISIGVGPGSFLGTRIGVTLAKTLAYGLDIPLVSFCSLKLYSPQELGPFCIVGDAKSQGVYTLRGANTEEGTFYETEESLHSLEEFALLYKEENFLPITPSEVMTQHLNSMGIPSLKQDPSFSAVCRNCYQSILASQHETAHTLTMHYLRPV